MAEILKGAPVTAALNEKLKGDVAELVEKGVQPCLAILRVGEREDDLAYERGALKRCANVGITVRQAVLPADVSQEDLMKTLNELNEDSTVHGILIFQPLPKHLDSEAVRAALKPEKDVDGITDGSMAGVFSSREIGFPPCTAKACIELLDHYGYELKGKRVTVVGRSLVIGKPVAMMLLQKNATVTICHTKTVDLAAECAKAEILVVAAGKAGVVGADHVSEGQIVVDVGINVNSEGKLCGDVDFAAVEPKVKAITPVPAGVGTVTTCVLAGHVVEAARRSLKG